MVTRGRQDLVGLVVGTLVTWRVSHLLVEEDGPGQVLTRLRRTVDATPLVGVLDCFGCTSVWVGAVASRAVQGRRVGSVDLALGGLAMSGAAFLVQKVLTRAEPADWIPEPRADSPLITVQE